jgi:peptide/nickel transport system permease protein
VRNYILRRVLMMVPLLLGISILSFTIIKLAPGDPASLTVNMNAKIDPGYITKLREAYGLNAPLYVQYGRWLKGMFTLDFGKSFKDDRPVIDVIAERLPATLLLSGISFVLLFLIAIPLGVAAAYYRGRWLDHFTTVFSFVGFATPIVWIALLVILIFSVQLSWFPVSGMWSVGSEYLPWYERLGDLAWHLVLPVAVSVFGGLASVSRYARSNMLEVLQMDYIRMARAKGLTEFRVVFRHALPNALLPIITLLGLSLPGLLAGGTIIETIFGWPGMGRLNWEAIMSRNYPVVMGIGIILAFFTLLGNLLADISYAALDPRIKYD